ncbi:MAG: tetratricopeptide repeat protein [Candidatus Magasanikbacteria bacterium]|nr:tetratricopeptide repeat protein [Candidatus Magasanikbacteria bacterium]
MFSILPFILIAGSFGVIVYIIVKKYPQLLLLDVGTLPEVQESKKKDEIIRKKAEIQTEKSYKKFGAMLEPFIHVLKVIQLKFRILVGNIYRKSLHEHTSIAKQVTHIEKIQKIEESSHLVVQAHQDAEQEDFVTAEKKYLAAIKQNPKNKDAYKGLAQVYFEQEQTDEAKEIYKFILQLDDQDEEVYLKLGEIAEEQGKLEEAVEYYQQVVLINPNNPQRFVLLFDLLFELTQYETALEAIEQALELEPQNPKYLDKFIETSILLRRKDLAEIGYRDLRMINPDNQKLVSFEERIDDI